MAAVASGCSADAQSSATSGSPMAVPARKACLCRPVMCPHSRARTPRRTDRYRSPLTRWAGAAGPGPLRLAAHQDLFRPAIALRQPGPVHWLQLGSYLGDNVDCMAGLERFAIQLIGL